MSATAFLGSTMRGFMGFVDSQKEAIRNAVNDVDSSAPQVDIRPRTCFASAGDSIWDIAKRYGVSPYLLLVANPGLEAPCSLGQGEELRLPAA